MTKHTQQNTEEHLRLAYHVIQEQRAEMELQRERLKKQEQAIWQLTESVGKLKVMCDERLKEKDQQEKTLSRVLDQLRDQKKHQSKFEKVSLSPILPSAPKYSSRHFIFHRKCVSLI